MRSALSCSSRSRRPNSSPSGATCLDGVPTMCVSARTACGGNWRTSSSDASETMSSRSRPVGSVFVTRMTARSVVCASESRLWSGRARGTRSDCSRAKMRVQERRLREGEQELAQQSRGLAQPRVRRHVLTRGDAVSTRRHGDHLSWEQSVNERYLDQSATAERSDCAARLETLSRRSRNTEWTGGAPRIPHTGGRSRPARRTRRPIPGR